jgi:predicted ATPase/DNA-binding SARP family transcriptional activator
MSRLAIFLLGAPRIELDSRPVVPDTRKAVALLAYLAVTGERHTRDTLAALLWPEYDQSRSRAALRRTLSALKSAVEGYGLDARRDSVGLDPAAGIWIDVSRFRELLAEPSGHDHPVGEVCPACLVPLTEAAGLYHNDFLAGFFLRDSVTFDDWHYMQSEELRRDLARVLDGLIQCHQNEGEFETALGYAHRLLELDPLRESAHRQLMSLYTFNGQRPAALRQYRACVRILEKELGVSPLEETTTLYEQILSGEVGVQRRDEQEAPGEKQPDPSPDQPFTLSPPHPLTLSPLPLVGRTEEWNNLLGWYDAVETDGRFLVLEGEAGIGKTRLAQTFLAYAREQGATIITATCYEGESGLAYAPLVEGLSEAIVAARDGDWWQAMPDPWLAEAARLLPDLAQLKPGLSSPAPLDSPGAQSRFFEAISRLLGALCAPSPVGVLFVDDLHWADEATLDLLGYLVRRLRGRPLFILATRRDDQMPAGQPLGQMLISGQRSGHAERITLQRLDESAVRALVESISTPPEEANDLAQKLYLESEGLPFFLVEYLAVLQDRGPAGAGGEAPGSLVSLSMPSSVRGLLHSRLAPVSETGRQILHTAAVVGRSFEFDTLREASGRSEEETIIALEELLARGLVIEQATEFQRDAAGPFYDFSHEKLRALVYEESSLARRRLLHRRVAQALVAGRRHIPAAQVATHYQQAGEEALAAGHFKEAGDDARVLYANGEALAHYQAALALGYPNLAVVHEAIGDLFTLRGQYNGALANYEAAAAQVEEGTQTGDLSRIEHKLGNVYDRLGEWDLAAGHYEAALEKAVTDGQRARQLGDWSLTAHRSGQNERAVELAEQAMILSRAAGDMGALAQTHNILGVLAKSRGDLEEASRYLEQSLASAESLSDPGVTIAALNNLSQAYGARGDMEDALALAGRALALGVELGDRHREAALQNNLADLLHTAGRDEEAMSHLKQAVAIYAEIGGDPGEWRPEIWKLTEW